MRTQFVRTALVLAASCAAGLAPAQTPAAPTPKTGARELIVMQIGDTLTPGYSFRTDSALVLTNGGKSLVAVKCGTGAVFLRGYKGASNAPSAPQKSADSVAVIVPCPASPVAPAPSPSPTPTPVDPLAEPVFDSTKSTMIYATDFESYTNAQLNPAAGQAKGPTFLNKTYVYGAASPNMPVTLVAGHASTQAVQFQYTGTSQESPGIAYYGSAGGGSNATPNNTTSIVQHWAKVAGVGAAIDATTVFQVKWLLLWHFDPTNSRIQFNTDGGQGGCGFNNWVGTGTKWEVYEGGTYTGCNALQPVSPYFPSVADGQWHRFTYLVKPNSSAGARDARALMWIDGVLVVRLEQSAVGVVPPGGTTNQPWCVQADVDAMIVGNGVGSPEFGGAAVRSFPLTIAIDDFKWWKLN